MNSQAATAEESDDNVYVEFASAGGYASGTVGRAVITKVDDSTSGVLLDGAKFELTDAPNSDANVLDVQVTGEDGNPTGQVIFDYIYYDTYYYYREVTPPSGYTGDTTTYYEIYIDEE